ncbi:hypothetical protein EJB05_28504, partial [Eragrostis curvula]
MRHCHWQDARAVLRIPEAAARWCCRSSASPARTRVAGRATYVEGLEAVYKCINGLARGMMWQLVVNVMARFDDRYGIVLSRQTATTANIAWRSEAVATTGVRDSLDIIFCLLNIPTLNMSNHTMSLLVAVTLLTIVKASPATALGNSTTSTAYDMLAQYDFPPGILPQGVKGYTLSPDGSFEVDLPGDCNLHAVDLKILYSSRISGNIQNRTIHSLEGVKVNVLLTWIDIDQVDRIEDQIQFHTNLESKSFPVDNFANSPQCE